LLVVDGKLKLFFGTYKTLREFEFDEKTGE
jgi:hypothetical protein